MTKRKKITLIIVFAAIGQFVLGAVLIAILFVPNVIKIWSLSVNHFEDQPRMTDYAYVDSRFGTLYFDDHKITFQTAFENHAKNYGNSHNMKDAEMTGSYIVSKDTFYYALSYQDSDGTYGIQIRKRPFIETTENLEEIYTETGFSNRPYSFSGFDTKIHFYSNSAYLFSYDISTNSKVNCNYTDGSTIVDSYYTSNGLIRESIESKDGVLELKSGAESFSVNVEETLPEVYKTLNDNSYNAKTIVYLQNNAFIFYDAEYCDYDACLRYNFIDQKLTFANSFYDKYGFGFGYQIVIPVLDF